MNADEHKAMIPLEEASCFHYLSVPSNTYLMIVPQGTLESGRWLAVDIVKRLFLFDLGNFGAL